MRGARLLQRLPSVFGRNVERHIYLVQILGSRRISSDAIVFDRTRGYNRAAQQIRCMSGQSPQINQSAEGEELIVDPKWGVLLLRGLPFTARQDEVKALFQAYELVPDKAVWFEKGATGRRTGCAYVAFANKEAAKAAARAQDMSKMGDRYIEVFSSDPSKLVEHIKKEAAGDRRPAARSEPANGKDGGGKGHEVRLADPSWGVVKLKGLPYTSTEEDIKAFMEGFEVVEGQRGIWWEVTEVGRPTGTAYVALKTQHAAMAAQSLDMKRIGSRYIEVFSQPNSDGLNDYLLDEAARDPPGDLSHLKYAVQVRGLPYGWTKAELGRVFRGVDIVPTGIHPVRQAEAFVVVANEASLSRALRKDRATLRHRYLEVWGVNGYTLVRTLGAGVLLSNLPDAGQRNVVRVRGLGDKASVAEVRQLLDGFKIEPYGVYVITPPNRKATGKGEAYVVMSSEGEAERACGVLNKKSMQVSKGDLYMATVSSPIVDSSAGYPLYANRPMTCVRLRFLPPDVKEDDLFAFFHGLNIKRVTVCRDKAVVQFATFSDCQRAMARNRDRLQAGDASPVEVVAVTKAKMRQFVAQGDTPGATENGGA